MGEHLNATLYRRAIAAFNAGDHDTLKGLIAADVVWHEAGDPQAVRGREAVLGRFGEVADDLEGDVRVIDILANDDRVVALLDVKMTRGMRKVRYTVVEVALIEDGMLVERWSFMDAVPTDVAEFLAA